MKDKRKQIAKDVAAKTSKNFGHNTGVVATDLSEFKLDVTSTGILALDYATGVGGWPSRFPVEVFGAPDIGKSTVIGLGGIREAQKSGKLCGLIAVEPSFDEAWAVKHGVDPDLLVVAYPDNGEDAFAIIHEWIEGGVPDFIVFDSLGGVSSKTKEAGGVKAFGASGLISANMTNLAPTIFKNDVSVIFLNQQRDDTKAKIPGLVKPPGGWAVQHTCPIRVHIKSGKDRYYTRVGSGDNASNVLVGRKLIANIIRNKLAEKSAPGFKAQFDFYHMETDEAPLGIDIGTDVATTGILSGVIKKGGSWYSHPSFPGKGNKLQGTDAIGNFISENPEILNVIRNDILDVLKTDLISVPEPTEEKGEE